MALPKRSIEHFQKDARAERRLELSDSSGSAHSEIAAALQQATTASDEQLFAIIFQVGVLKFEGSVGLLTTRAGRVWLGWFCRPSGAA